MILRNYRQSYRYRKLEENYRKIIDIEKFDLSPTPSFTWSLSWTGREFSEQKCPDLSSSLSTAAPDQGVLFAPEDKHILDDKIISHIYVRLLVFIIFACSERSPPCSGVTVSLQPRSAATWTKSKSTHLHETKSDSSFCIKLNNNFEF